MGRTSCTVSFLLAGTLFGQVGQAPAPKPDPAAESGAVFRTDARLVVLNVSVFDKNMRLVEGLPRSAFKVFEDDAAQEITVFRREDAPVSMGLVIDNSASMMDKREKVAAAALDMVRKSNPEDEVFIIKFSDDPALVRDYTSNVKELESSLNRFDSRGATAMRDALRLGIEHLRHKGKKDKRVLLVVTDGDDNSSVETLAHLVQVSQQSEVIIYGIGLLAEEMPRAAARARQALEALTQATGGRAWFPKTVNEIDSIAPEIAHEIRNQYVVGYSPSKQAVDNTFRKVRVEVNVPGAIVRTRPGYWATLEPISKAVSSSPVR